MFKGIKTLLLCRSAPRGRSEEANMSCCNENVMVSAAKKDLLFINTWKLESLLSSTSSSGTRLPDYSGVFPAAGYTWRLALNLGKVEAEDLGKSYLSLFLALLDDASLLPLHTEVVLELSIFGENYSQCSKKKVIHRFQQSKSGEKRHPYLISLETLECPSSGFLVAEIIDVVIHSQENVSLSPKFEDNSPAYTWKIDGFSKLTKESYTSGPFLYNNHIWYLALYPKGCLEEKDKSISLYLNLDDVGARASSVVIRAEYYLELVDQIEGKNHQDIYSHVFSQKSQSWGWRKFMSLDALHEPSKGLLVNDTCIIKVGFLKCDISK